MITLYNTFLVAVEKIAPYTNRPMKKNEREFRDFVFISEQEFKYMEKQGEFIETKSLNIISNLNWMYGVKKSDVIVKPNELKVIIAHPNFVKKIYENHREIIDNGFLIHIMEPVQSLKKGCKRGSYINARLEMYAKESQEMFDYLDKHHAERFRITTEKSELAKFIINFQRRVDADEL